MRTVVKFGIAFVLVSVTVVLCWFAINVKPHTVKVNKTFSYGIAEGFRVRNPNTGVDSVTFDSCRIEKLRSGPITFGGLNVLCIDGLVINLPFYEHTKSNREKEFGKSRYDTYVKTFSQRILPFGKVSGIKVRGIQVNKIVGHSTEPVFSAAEMRNHGKTLLMKDCRIFSDNHTNLVGKAMLQTSPTPMLVWNGGKRSLEDLFPSEYEVQR